jgi:undecaprenyl-diphosphatase
MSAPLSVLDAAILGVVEGVTEYLPVSSTGHLVLASSLLGLNEPAERKHAVDAFNIVVQGGAILAVLGLYWPSVLRMVRGVLGRDNGGFMLLVNLVIAFLPAAAIGFALKDWIEATLFHPWPVIAALVVGGVFMIWLDWWRCGRLSRPRYHARASGTMYDMTPRQALIVGLMQVVAMWPGTSRSMMTITGAMVAGLKPRQAAEFSFLLGVLTLGAASAYTLAKNLHEARSTNTPNMFGVLGWTPVLVGLVVAAVSAGLAVKWLVGFLTRHGLAPFGWYRIVLGVVLGVLMWRGVVEM